MLQQVILAESFSAGSLNQKQINFLTHEVIVKFGLCGYIGDLFNQLLDSPGSINEEWATKLVYPLYKKGDKSDPSNYRPLSDNLLFTTKILHNILWYEYFL